MRQIVQSYRPPLLTPVQLFAHDLHDAWQRFIGRLHVQEAQASSAGDDIDGCAGVLLDRVQNLRKEDSREAKSGEFKLRES